MVSVQKGESYVLTFHPSEHLDGQVKIDTQLVFFFFDFGFQLKFHRRFVTHPRVNSFCVVIIFDITEDIAFSLLDRRNAPHSTKSPSKREKKTFRLCIVVSCLCRLLIAAICAAPDERENHATHIRTAIRMNNRIWRDQTGTNGSLNSSSYLRITLFYHHLRINSYETISVGLWFSITDFSWMSAENQLSTFYFISTSSALFGSAIMLPPRTVAPTTMPEPSSTKFLIMY